MTRLLHLDASARPGRYGVDPHGSHTRALSHRFVSRWRAARPQDSVRYRDVGAAPPRPVDVDWIRAAFAQPERREPWMAERLAESEALIAELLEADVLVLGVPLYNFGMPAPFKAWIDNIVRIDRTFAFEPQRDDPYIPLLADRPRHAALLTSRGTGGPQAHAEHLEPHLRTAFGFIGIDDIRCVAVEYEEIGGEALAASVAEAQARVDRLVDALLAETAAAVAAPDGLAVPA